MLAVEPEIVERYVRGGQVLLVFRDVLNHGPRSERTSEAAACAGQQGQFWQMHALLFERQPEVSSTRLDDVLPLLLGYAAELDGLDQGRFATCLEERSSFEALQVADQEHRERGILSQPVFEIGSQRLVGGRPAVSGGSVRRDRGRVERG